MFSRLGPDGRKHSTSVPLSKSCIPLGTLLSILKLGRISKDEFRDALD
jgi:hypothetical protein